MYFYHLKFELYVPAEDNSKDLINSSIDINNRQKKTLGPKKPADLFYVPKDIFETLPAHPQHKNESQKFLPNRNSKGHSKIRSKSLDPSQNTVHSTAKVPLIPPTPVSKNSNSQTVKNSLLSWETVSKRKSVASTSTAISSSASVLDKTHDFRFGGIEVEWFDNCEENMNGDQKEQNIGSYANAVKGGQNETLNSDNTLSTQSSNVLPPHDPSSSQTSTRTNKQKTKSSNDKLTNSPAGKFVPLKSGTTNLSCGILHLYRDPKEILPPNDNQESGLALSVEAEEKQDESLSVLGNDDTILAVLAVPSYLSASDFLGFVAPVQRFVSHFRFIRDSAPNKFIVLMKFRHSRAAKDFYKQYNGRPFSSMEPEICHLVYIKSIEFKSTSIPPYIFPFLHDPFSPSAQEVSKLPAGNDQIQKSPILYELPTCPVCLERMDASVTGLLTILCQHTFHCNCLSKWGDICRYSQKHYDYDPSMEQNECGVCGATENLWICLVCGNIGCGRYQEAHAYCHYKETSHLYALELETQRVWDYAGDGYVHRLIQNKSDGKLVELPSPDAHPQMQQSNTDQVVQQEKLDAIGLEYSYLLSTQLSSQRTYYEEKLESVTLQLSNLTNQLQNLANEVSTLNQDKDKYKREKELLEKEKIPILLKEKKTVEKKVEKFVEKSERLERELNEEKELTKSLLSKQEYLQTQLEERDNKIKDLEEQVRDLMFFFSAQDKMAENPELAGGNVVIPENNGGNVRKKKCKK